MTGQQRLWLAYHVVLVTALVGFGVVSILDGGDHGLLRGAALVAVGGYLGLRTTQGMRRTAGPQVSDVRLGSNGVVVLNGDQAAPGEAFLRWDDCVAVVASPVSGPRPLYYVHFMPVRDDAVTVTGVPRPLLRNRAALVDIPVSSSAAMVWVVAEATLPRMYDALDRVRDGRPGLRVVDSTRRSSAGG